MALQIEGKTGLKGKYTHPKNESAILLEESFSFEKNDCVESVFVSTISEPRKYGSKPFKETESMISFEENVSFDESELRIIWYLVGTSIVFLLIAITGLIWIHNIYSQYVSITLEPKIPLEPGTKFPLVHLAMIFDGGHVYDCTLDNQGIVIHKKMLKLPYSYKYFGYTDNKGAVYFVHSHGSKGITRYYVHTEKGSLHTVVENSKEDIKEAQEFDYTHGQLLGNKFWTFGKKQKTPIFKPYVPESRLWSVSKGKWINGPVFTLSQTQYKVEMTCSTTLDSHTVILITGDFLDEQEQKYFNAVIQYDFRFNKYSLLSYLPFEVNLMTDLLCKAAEISFNKNGAKSLNAIIEYGGLQHWMSYNLDDLNAKWTFRSELGTDIQPVKLLRLKEWMILFANPAENTEYFQAFVLIGNSITPVEISGGLEINATKIDTIIQYFV